MKGKIKEVADILAADGGGTVDPPIPTKIDTLAVPGKFEAEKASTLSSGIQIEATTDAGGGSDLGYTTNGSAEYTIKVAQAGGYTLRARVATDESGTLTFKVNNNQIGTIAVSKTGGWQSWQTMETPVQINTAGVTKLQVGWTGAVNLNWLEIASGTASVKASSEFDHPLSVRTVSNGLHLILPEGARGVSVSDLQGRILSQQMLSGERELTLSVPASGVKIVKVATDNGTLSATVAPSR